MMSYLQTETHSEKNDLAIEEIALRIESLNRDVEELLSELNVTPHQLSTFLSNEENFSKENFDMLVQQKKALDEKLLKELVNVSNPLKTKKTYSERNVQPHWLFVR